MNIKFKKILSVLLIVIIAVSAVFVQSASAKDKKTKEPENEIVTLAKQYLGCPYVHGRSGPDAFDCSGFVKFIFGHYGFNFPNSSSYFRSMPEKYAKVVSEKDAKPGDIISWAGHVGIYVGHGKVIHALNPRTGVCITKVADFHNRWGAANPAHTYYRVDMTAPEAEKEAEKKKEAKKLSKKLGTANLEDNFFVSLSVNKMFLSETNKNAVLSEETNGWLFSKCKDGSYIIGNGNGTKYLTWMQNFKTGTYNLQLADSKKNASNFFIYKSGKNYKLKDADTKLYISADKNHNNLTLSKKASGFRFETEDFIKDVTTLTLDAIVSADSLTINRIPEETIHPAELSALSEIPTTSAHCITI